MPVRVSDGILVFEVSTAPGGLVPVTREVTVRDERAPDAKLAQHRVSLRRKAFANPFRRAIGRVVVQILLSVCICLARRLSRFQAAKTAVQIPGAVVACPVSGLRLNCCFLIFSASSMPRIVTAAPSLTRKTHKKASKAAPFFCKFLVLNKLNFTKRTPLR